MLAPLHGCPLACWRSPLTGPMRMDTTEMDGFEGNTGIIVLAATQHHCHLTLPFPT